MTRTATPAPRRARWVAPVVLMASAIGAAAATPANAQEVRTIQAEPACAACEIRLGEPIRLQGEFGDPGTNYRAQLVIQGPDQRFYVVYSAEWHQIHVHARDGVFEHRIGRQGQGPGEFLWIGRLRFGSDGHLHVLDRQLGRLTVVNPTTREVVVTQSLPVSAWDALPLESGALVISGPIAARQTAGFPLHVYHSDGRWQRSFGLDQPVLRFDLTRLLVRHLEPGESGSFWAAPMNDYRFELWDHEGRRHAVLAGERQWFESWWERVSSHTLDEPPSSHLWDIQLDAEGYLWTLSTTASEQWRDALDPDRRDAMGNLRLRPGARYMDTVIEVLDPQAGTLLARLRLPHAGGGFAGPRMAWRSWIDEDGYPQIEVYRLQLEGTP